MADAKLTALTAASALAAADLFYVSQSAASRKATGTQLLALVGTAYVPLAGGTMTGALTIASGTLTASAPALSITQTWNANVAFTASKVNVTKTLSDGAGLLQDWQRNGTSMTRIREDGVILTEAIVCSYGGYFANVIIGDTVIERDTTNALAQRNGTTQQTFRLYNTYTDSSNYERLTLTGVAGSSVNITAETLGTGGDDINIVLTPAGAGSFKVPGNAGSGVSLNWYEFGARLSSGAEFVWTSGFTNASVDTGFRRNAAGIVEVNNGTAGTYRDLKLRNLLSTGYATIDSGTLTASAPALSITQTWNQGATAFTGALIDITNTASSDPSRALDVRIAGSSIFSVRPDGYAISSTGLFVGSGGTNGLWDSVGPHVKSTGAYSWAQSENATETSDLFLYRDAAASLALRNGTAQQSFSVYNTYTDSSNYERLKLTGVAGTSVNITAETLGTGADNLDIVLTPAGGGFVSFPGGLIKLPLNATFRNTDSMGNGLFYMDVSNLVLRRGDAASSFGAILFGGTSSSEPGIKKNGAALDLRLADDSAYTDLKLRNLIQTEYQQMTEMTAPSAPATNSVRIYAEDNGAGKTRLMALFATGVAQQIAIEP